MQTVGDYLFLRGNILIRGNLLVDQKNEAQTLAFQAS